MLHDENKQALNPVPEKGRCENRERFCEFWSKTLERETKEL